MIKSVDRLEQGLRLWEDHCFFYNKLVQFARALPSGVAIEGCSSGLSTAELQHLNVGPFIHSGGFRKYMLNSLSSGNQFDFDKYIGIKRVRDLLGSKSWLPMSLWAWTRESRRVYQLSRELQLLLGVTSLNGVTWGDLHFPFDAFAIALEDPLTDEQSDEKYDLLIMSMITKQNDTDSWIDIDVTLFPARLESYNKSIHKERNDAFELLRSRKWGALTKWFDKFQKRFRDHGVLGFNFSYSKNKNAPIIDEKWSMGTPEAPDWSEPLDPGAPTIIMKATRIIAGLVLYFKSLPPHHTCIREEHRTAAEHRERARSPDKSCITDIAQVCTVSSVFELSQEERKILESCRTGAGGFEVRAHFRCGHWRRPPGLGTDPTAEKTVWVRPTLVRRDRVPEGAVPGGSETDL